MRVAIIQSNYIPWKGYFDAMAAVDEFILLDEVQYTKRDWRNRNRIRSAAGTQWLTIPVQVKGRYHQRIDETLVAEPDWAARHWATLRGAYRRAPHFDAVAEWLEPLYAAERERLSDVNRALLEGIRDALGIGTPLRWSTEYAGSGERGERILSLCKAAGADEYVSGPAARAYLDEASFAAEGVRVRWLDYEGYREYPQFGDGFEHGVSALDLLFHTGPDAAGHLKTFAHGRDAVLV
jgi:hypothetical protein